MKHYSPKPPFFFFFTDLPTNFLENDTAQTTFQQQGGRGRGSKKSFRNSSSGCPPFFLSICVWKKFRGGFGSSPFASSVFVCVGGGEGREGGGRQSRRTRRRRGRRAPRAFFQCSRKRANEKQCGVFGESSTPLVARLRRNRLLIGVSEDATLDTPVTADSRDYLQTSEC
ncbi:hypothetical protein CDAR_589291 [Caerostris darwini]|uniref:Uncharacterized protein n=1 Tax=Caerostris darwini TaxID=1538125 RepID=A0AAV4T7J8_9ARAC|nr:hypothetical protein CDAR_589291 [Caerostris darwini]